MELWRLQSKPITLKREMHQIVCDRFFNQRRTTGLSTKQTIYKTIDGAWENGLNPIITDAYRLYL